LNRGNRIWVFLKTPVCHSGRQ